MQNLSKTMHLAMILDTRLRDFMKNVEKMSPTRIQILVLICLNIDREKTSSKAGFRMVKREKPEATLSRVDGIGRSRQSSLFLITKYKV